MTLSSAQHPVPGTQSSVLSPRTLGARSTRSKISRHHLRAAALQLLCTCCAVAVPAASVLGVEGFTEPYRVIRIAAPEAGAVAQLVVREGAQVRSGERVANLDAEVHEALLAVAAADCQSRGRLEAAQAELRLRENRHAALRRLGVEGHARQEEIERAEADRDIAAAQLRSAEEAIHLKELEQKKIRAQVERRTIRSPIDGVVAELLKEQGEFVSAADPYLMTIVQLDPLAATFAVPRDQIDSLSTGQSVRIQLTERKAIKDATVEFISSVIDAESGTVRVRVVISNPEGADRSGERCKLLFD